MNKLIGLALIIAGFLTIFASPVIGSGIVIAGLLITWNAENKG